MRNKTFLNRAWVTLLAVLVLLPVISCTVTATSTVDLTKEGSVTITLTDPEAKTGIEGAVIELYHVAEARSEDHMLSFALTSDFADSGVSLKDLQDKDLVQDLADFAAKTATLQKRTGTTGKDGTFCFTGLETGLYLAVQQGSADGYYSMSPFLICLPQTADDGSEWLFDVTASPKMEKLPTEPADPVSLTVKKEWVDNDIKKRPTSVTVNLLGGTEVVDTVTLSAANNWSHTWNELDASIEWTVQEINIPNNYKESYSVNGTVITITNASSLLQTGQLNWPIPILAIAGLLLFAFGWTMTFFGRKNGENEA